jgi:hypothetical protein
LILLDRFFPDMASHCRKSEALENQEDDGGRTHVPGFSKHHETAALLIGENAGHQLLENAGGGVAGPEGGPDTLNEVLPESTNDRNGYGRSDVLGGDLSDPRIEIVRDTSRVQ